MSAFLFNYGLFTAKTITVFILILATLAGFLMLLSFIVSNKQRNREFIEIENINEKYEALKDALEAEILSKEEIKNLTKKRKKQEKDKEKEVKKRLKDGQEEPLKPRVFVLRFNGDIEASEVDCLREEVSAIILAAKKDDEVLMILDSAGGYVHNYGLAASQLKRLRQRELPLTVSIDLVAASGGYMMAAVANMIIAAPFAVVGSIGVLAQLPNFNRLLKKYDIDIEQHTAGEYKTTLTMLGQNTEKAREKFREELEDTHLLFKNHVKEHRPKLDIEKLATGEHWYGTKALQLNLIDDIITSDDYLLKRVETYDIYEVNYVIHESLSDKLSNMLQKGCIKLVELVQLILQIPFFQSRLKS